MKTPATHEEVLLLLRCLYEDFEALRTGDWAPDDDSCYDCMDVVTALKRYICKLPLSPL